MPSITEVAVLVETVAGSYRGRAPIPAPSNEGDAFTWLATALNDRRGQALRLIEVTGPDGDHHPDLIISLNEVAPSAVELR